MLQTLADIFGLTIIGGIGAIIGGGVLIVALIIRRLISGQGIGRLGSKNNTRPPKL